MKKVGDVITNFSIVGIKPGFNFPEERGQSAFKRITNLSFLGMWKVMYFYPKDFTFVCPTEIGDFAVLSDQFNIRNAVLMGGNSDTEFGKLAWRRQNSILDRLNHLSFCDPNGSLIDQLGIRDRTSGLPLRSTFILDGRNVVQYCSTLNPNVGRNPEEILRILDALQTKRMCASKRQIGDITF
jgi:alkyl hydroperoxide reductase subunit AhpC